MNPSTKSWIGQVTTGHGAMVIVPTLLAVLSGTMSWQIAFPLLVAGTVGLIWPENTVLQSAAQTAASDLEKIVARFNDTMTKAAVNAPPPPDPRQTAAGFAIVAAIGLSLAACADQTPAQQAAEVHAIECIADTAGKIAIVDVRPGSATDKIAGSANALSGGLANDPACQAALVSGPATP